MEIIILLVLIVIAISLVKLAFSLPAAIREGMSDVRSQSALDKDRPFFKCKNGEVVAVDKIVMIRKVNEAEQIHWEVVVENQEKTFIITNAEYKKFKEVTNDFTRIDSFALSLLNR